VRLHLLFPDSAAGAFTLAMVIISIRAKSRTARNKAAMVPMLIVKPEAFSQRIISLILGSTIPVKEGDELQY
jgi:hypothetical protein